MENIKVIVLNPPSPDASYINRDQMGGMGQRINFGNDIKSKLLSKLKSNFIHLPVVQLVYAATILAENGFEVKVIDALNEDMDINQCLKSAKGFNPDLLVMSVSSSCLLFERDVVAKKFKEMYPQVKVITVGDAMTHATDQFKEPFDVAIVGEVERVIVGICGSVVSGHQSRLLGVQPMNRRSATATPPASLLAVSSNPRFLSSVTQFATTTPIPA